MNRSTTLPQTLPRSFQELCSLCWPRPIHDNVDYDNVTEMLDRLVLQKRRSKDQDEYLEILTLLVENYDAKQVGLKTARQDPIATLRFLMEGRDMSGSDLGRVLGNRSLGPAILRGDRKISKANAIKLARHFSLSPSVFLQV
jgi:HTH-type transcriptional regulator/antitoxin HigA